MKRFGEQGGLGLFQRRGAAEQRDPDQQADVGEKTPEQGMGVDVPAFQSE